MYTCFHICFVIPYLRKCAQRQWCCFYVSTVLVHAKKRHDQCKIALKWAQSITQSASAHIGVRPAWLRSLLHYLSHSVQVRYQPIDLLLSRPWWAYPDQCTCVYSQVNDNLRLRYNPVECWLAIAGLDQIAALSSNAVPQNPAFDQLILDLASSTYTHLQSGLVSHFQTPTLESIGIWCIICQLTVPSGSFLGCFKEW